MTSEAGQHACKHCGTPFTPTQEQPDYCCNGCAFVANMIEDAGYSQYYNLRDAATEPARAYVFQERDYAWLQKLTDTAESNANESGVADLKLDVQGLSCVGCVWLIEQVFERFSGGLKIELNAQLGRIRLRWTKGAFNPVNFAQELQRFGYLLGPPSAAKHDESRRLLGSIGLCGAFAMNAMLFTLPTYLGMADDDEFAGLFKLVVVLFSTLSFVVGGSYFISRAWRAAGSGLLHMDTPIALGLCVAYVGSVYGWLSGHESLFYFDFVAIFAFLMLVGRWAQERTVERNRTRLLSQQAQPENVTVIEKLPDGTQRTGDLVVENIYPNCEYQIRKGQLVPVASMLSGDSAEFSLEWINGESVPRLFKKGQGVPAGALLLSNEDAVFSAREKWEESLLYRLWNAQADSESALPQRILSIYLKSVLVISQAGMLAWWWAGASIVDGLQVALSILVVSCPCALGVAVPLANEIAASRLRKFGVYVRRASLWARLKKVDTILFDKTGTLTLESPKLSNAENLKSLSGDHQQALFMMVQHGLHPVARSLREHLLALNVKPLLKRMSIDEETGMGVSAKIDGSIYSLGRAGWRAGKGSNAQVVFADGQQVIAEFYFTDQLRGDAKKVVQELLKNNYELSILSGDRKEKVDTLAEELGLLSESTLANCTPEEKANWIQKNAPDRCLMIGDGANDALAFEKALCSGTPVVEQSLLEHKADFYLTGSGLNGLRKLLDTSKRRDGAVMSVFVFALSYNSIAISLCLAGLMNPLLAAILMPVSSIVSIAITQWRMK